ncbi:MAG: hypothetical protein ACP5UR_10615 [Chloroflexus sp.]|uniref:hypothetical protein n=1 Tax=Chloroflexus sp. TaxID=1904827 RepID=UPI003D143617
MGVTIGLIGLLAAAVMCFLLTTTGLTRRMGLFAALAAGLATVGVALDPVVLAPTDPLLTIGAIPLTLPSAVALSERAIVVAILLSGTVGLLALALTAPPSTIGLGALFGWLLISLAAALLSWTIPPLSFFTPLSWVLAVVSVHGSLLAASMQYEPDRLPGYLIAGAVAVVAASSLITTMALQPPDTLPAPVIVVIAIIGALALAGAPPFAGTRLDAVGAPPLIGALTVGVVLPSIGLGFIVRILPQLPPLPDLASAVLAAAGTLGALGAAFGALRSTSGRELVFWQGAMQAGLVVCASAINDPLAGLAASALLLVIPLHAVTGGLVVAAIERHQSSDTLDGTPAQIRLPLTGVLWMVITATATGFPVSWSFWGWRWLSEALVTRLAWAIPPLIAAAVIGLAAGLPLLFRCWYGRAGVNERGREQILGVLILAPLVLAGIAPWLAWPLWLSWSPFAPPILPAEPIAWPFVGLALAIGIGGWFLARHAVSSPSLNPGEAVIPTWQGMGKVLGWPVEIANARTMLTLIGRGLDRVATLLHTAMIIFEQRYYLFGVIVALIAILVLMAQ